VVRRVAADLRDLVEAVRVRRLAIVLVTARSSPARSPSRSCSSPSMPTIATASSGCAGTAPARLSPTRSSRAIHPARW
jgi:hypothetical protein